MNEETTKFTKSHILNINKNRIIIKDFIIESNEIEGITTFTILDDIKQVIDFLLLDKIKIINLKRYIKYFQPNAILRDKSGLDVRVGNYIPLKGGAFIKRELKDILECYNSDYNLTKEHLYILHCRYEQLHPFTDCNGRSGRMLWLWHYFNIYSRLPNLGFLHTFYYDSLNDYRIQGE